MTEPSSDRTDSFQSQNAGCPQGLNEKDDEWMIQNRRTERLTSNYLQLRVCVFLHWRKEVIIRLRHSLRDFGSFAPQQRTVR